ncbi:MAG TPA: PaaI family thioesterase [Rubrivivax sp.]|nr:PaaI family thioesterase [Rubrivivax sp.]
MQDVPPGYRPVDAGGGFMAANGPLFLLHEGKAVKVGFRVEPRHCNPMGVCHGGMLASFCDMLLPLSVHRKSTEVGQRFLPTVSLQLDYMAPVPLGAWVEGECDVLKVTRTMVFAQGLARADGVAAVRCSGVFKIGPRFGDDAR